MAKVKTKYNKTKFYLVFAIVVAVLAGIAHLWNLSPVEEQLLAKRQQRIEMDSIAVSPEVSEQILSEEELENDDNELLSTQEAMPELTEEDEELMSLRFEKESAEMQLKRTKKELASANERITDLESRPVEIAVQEDEEGKMAKVLVKELGRKLSEADQEHVNAMENQRKKYQAQINSLEEQLEQEKNKPAETVTVKDDKGIFKAYYSAALSSFENLLKFVADCSDKDFCIEKAEKLLEICREKLGEIT